MLHTEQLQGQSHQQSICVSHRSGQSGLRQSNTQLPVHSDYLCPNSAAASFEVVISTKCTFQTIQMQPWNAVFFELNLEGFIVHQPVVSWHQRTGRDNLYRLVTLYYIRSSRTCDQPQHAINNKALKINLGNIDKSIFVFNLVEYLSVVHHVLMLNITACTVNLGIMEHVPVLRETSWWQD